MNQRRILARARALSARVDGATEFNLRLTTKSYRATTTGKELLAVVSKHRHPAALPVDYAGIRSEEASHRVSIFQKPKGAARGENVEAISHAYVKRPADVGKMLKRQTKLFGPQGIGKWRKKTPTEEFSARLRLLAESCV